jgi:indolepyruvate ferredoxin oxidoreductase
MEAQIADAVGPGHAEFVAGTRLASALLGDSIAANLFMVGYAYQRGLIPLSGGSILKAIEMNGVAVAMNKAGFLWGRRAALDPVAVDRVAAPPESLPDSQRLSETLDKVIARRVEDLTSYQDARYAQRYATLVRQVRDAEAARIPGHSELAEAVARYYYKLLAYKDEYEIARLYTDTGFLDRLNAMFEGDFKISFNLAPPLWSRRDPATREPRKQAYGPWVLHIFKVLARLKGLRGGALDIFGYTKDRKMDRRLIADYEKMIGDLIGGLNTGNHGVAVELASLPEQIRGYGHIRERHLENAKKREAQLFGKFRGKGLSDPGRDQGIQRSDVVMAG